MEAVLFEQISAANGSEVGVIVLNQPKWLNGLSLEMARAITRQLALWRDDDRVRVVLLRGQGEKSLFARVGICNLFYRHIPEPGMPIWSSEYLRTFFRDEYILDYMIHTYPKPIVCWANGYVMGGGAGLMMGCSHRVATETTRFAMPEISIGVVPDVGASWFLNRMPEFFGRLLGMTGMSINAADTLLGLAQYVAHSSQWDQLLHDVQAESWGMHREVNDVLLEQVIRRLTFEDIPDGMMQRSAKAIQSACSGPDFFTIYGNILRWELGDEEVLGQAAQRMKAGSPGSVRLTFELLKKGRFLSLPDAFRLEYIAALNCAGNPDLKEGIRALLIDKDRSPAWMPATINEADAGFVARYFEPPWPPGEAHPLASLGAG